MNTTSQAQPFVAEYEVAHGFNAHGLSKEVNAFLKKGFLVYGQPFSKGSDGIFQAMIKLDERMTKVMDKALTDLS
jgi:hypothetical protein